MGIAILNLKDGHYAKTQTAVKVATAEAAKGNEVQLDTPLNIIPQFPNGYGYVLFGQEDEAGYRPALAELVIK